MWMSEVFLTLSASHFLNLLRSGRRTFFLVNMGLRGPLVWSGLTWARTPRGPSIYLTISSLLFCKGISLSSSVVWNSGSEKMNLLSMTSSEPVQNFQPRHRLELVLEWSVLDPDRSRSLLLSELHLRVPEVESPLLPASCWNSISPQGPKLLVLNWIS